MINSAYTAPLQHVLCYRCICAAAAPCPSVPASGGVTEGILQRCWYLYTV